MNLLYERRKIPSAYNSSIDLKVWFGEPVIYVDGYDQSTHYIAGLWFDALARLPQRTTARNVLMLGLGLGVAIPEILRRFPSCTITVIEWDPEIIRLFQEFHSGKFPVTIIQGDAGEIVPALTETFDLVLVDLFNGDVADPQLAGGDLAAAIAAVVASNGHCILNAFKDTHLFPIFAPHFSHHTRWTFQSNALGAYT